MRTEEGVKGASYSRLDKDKRLPNKRKANRTIIETNRKELFSIEETQYKI